MGRNKAPDAIVARRRELVGQMLCRKMTRREIVDGLAAAEEKNPDTGQPWELGTIQRDAAALERQGKAAAGEKADVWKARQLAEIEEVKREALARGKLDIVLSAIEKEMKITGTQAPAQTELVGNDGTPLPWPVLIVIPENGRTLPMQVLQLAAPKDTDDDGETDAAQD